MSAVILNKKNLKEIVIHVAVWVLFFVVLNYQLYSEIRYVPKEILYRTLYRTLLNIGLFYLNYSFLVPRFLLKKKLRKYVLICLSIIFLNVLAVGGLEAPPPGKVVIRRAEAASFYEMDSLPYDRTVRIFPEDSSDTGIRGRYLFSSAEEDTLISPAPAQAISAMRIRFEEGHKFWRLRLMMSLRAAMVVGMYFVIGAAVKIYMEWKRGEAIRNRIQSEKITSELQFLKAQLNPHFLFNSLNSIYSLSVKKSNDTPEAIITLSDLMRYMLYEANREFVPLGKELEYIKNYIKLQRLRLSDGERVTLNIYGDERDRKIQPLLFISFIENAFKYGTDYTGKTVVKTVISIKENTIHFYIRNIIGRYKKNSESSGVGLENIKNRLNLLYPDSHKLDIEDDGKTFTVSLTLNFVQG